MTLNTTTKVVCDRCGLTEDAPNTTRPPRWDSLMISDRSRGGVDLCPACAEAFRVWYDTPKQVEATTGENKP